MRRFFIIISICVLSLGILLVGQAKAQKSNYYEDNKELNKMMDLAVVQVESQVVRDFLKSEIIRVRNPKTNYMPKGTLPIVMMKKVDEEECQVQLEKVLSVYGEKANIRFRNMRGALYASPLPGASCWIHTASGGYKYTVTKEVMSKPTKLKDFKEAVHICLEHIAKNNIVELTEGEELDILGVSAVNNALTNVNAPDEPIEQFISDYYVSFGRRLRGIPIIGSHLVIRIDGEGKVVMVKSNWREIEKVEEKRAKITEKPLRELILNNPEFREEFKPRKITIEDINIVAVEAGYIEAPFYYSQETLKPGCIVQFWVGKNRDEMLSQLFIPLEEEGSMESLLGRKQL